MTFNKWLDTLVAEKGLDPEQVFQVQGPSGVNFMPLGCVMDAMKQTTGTEQNQIKAMLVKIDFKNGDVTDYFKYLAGAIAA